MTKKTKTQLPLVIAILSVAGKQGKSTVARHVFSDMPLRSFDGINASCHVNSSEVEADDIHGGLLFAETGLYDIGTSRYAEFMELLANDDISRNNIDRFIIPTMCEVTPLQDALTTSKQLVALGVPTDRIKVVFNRYEATDVQTNNVTDTIISLKKIGVITDTTAVIPFTDIFESCGSLLVPELARMRSTVTQEIKDSPTRDNALFAQYKLVLKAESLNANLSTVYTYATE